MPNWKKMAEAFGRATHGRNNSENPAIKMARDGYNRDLRNYADKDAGDRAEAFFRGGEERWLNRDKDVAQFEDEASDKRLAEDFEDAFNSAAERHGYDTWKKGSGNKPLDDGLNGEIHNLEREGAEDDIRAQMIEELKSGVDLSDFFEKYR